MAAGQEVEQKAGKMAAALNATIEKKRTAQVEKLKKAAKGEEANADFDAKVWKISLRVSNQPATLKRTPEAQALEIAEGDSFTCASAHMMDMARHLDFFQYQPGSSTREYIKDLPSACFGTKDEHFMTLSEFQTEFASAMTGAGLVNYQGGKTFAPKDAWHVELKGGKGLSTAPEAKVCMAEYARLTITEGKYGANTEFEKDPTWGPAVKPYLEAAKKEKEEADRKKQLEELKKLQLDGKIKATVKLGAGITRNGTFKKDNQGSVLPPKDIEAGKASTRKLVVSGEADYDDAPRAILEKLKFLNSKGSSVQVICKVSADVIGYENLSQSFLDALSLQCDVKFNSLLAKLAKLDVTATVDLALGKSDKAVKGTVTFDLQMKGPSLTHKGSVTFQIDGATATAKVKLG